MPQVETANLVMPPHTTVLVQYQGTGATSQEAFYQIYRENR